MTLGNEIDVTHCHTIWQFDKYVTPKVFKFIGPSNDGRRHGRGTYLFGFDQSKFVGLQVKWTARASICGTCLLRQGLLLKGEDSEAL
jgi:hypothetical protein